MAVDQAQQQAPPQGSQIEVPGATQPGQASPFVGQAAPGQPSIPPTFFQPGVGQYDVFTHMQGYYGPLQTSPTPAMPQLDDPTMQALAQRIQALRDSHAVLNGTQPPDVNSVIARQSANMSALQIAGAVGQETWQQAVMQPFQDFVSTWQHDWKAGLLETIGGAALIGGAIGLEAITGGAATPLIFGVGAALVAPGMIKAWGDELQHPTDSNLVKALVGTATGIIAVGTPVKWSQGMSMGRNSLAFMLRAKKEMLTADDLVPKILSGQPELRKSLMSQFDIRQQMEVMATHADDRRAQFERLGVPLADKKISELLARTTALDGITRARDAAKARNDVPKVNELEAKMKHYAKTEVLPLQLPVAAHYLFLMDNKFQHIPLGITDKTMAVPGNIQTLANQSGMGILGIIRQIGEGHGFGQELNLSAKSAIEHHGRDLAAGGTGYNIAEMHRHHDELVKALGLSEEQITDTELAMEDPELWKGLSGRQEIYGQYRNMIHSAMSVNQMKWGTIENAVAGYLPRMFSGAEDTAHTRGVRDLFAGMRGAMLQRSRIYQAAIDAQGDVKYFSETRADLLKREGEEGKRYKEVRPLVEHLRENTAAVKAARETASGYKRWISTWRNRNRPDKVAETEAKLQRHYTEQAAINPLHGELVAMHPNKFESLQRVAPLQRKLVTGTDLFRASTASYAYRLEEASLRAHAETSANMSVAALRKEFLKVPLGKFGIELQHPDFRSKGETPDFMPESAFSRGTNASAGYKPVFRAIGRPGEIHYRPALYARDELADELHKVMDAAITGSETFSGFSGAVYKVLHGSKRAIMATPFWHAMNVGGRAVAFLLDDPVGAGTALSTVWGKGEHLLDPQMRAMLSARAGQAGLLHANKFEVTNQRHRAMRNEDAQSSWPTALRTVIGPLSHAYQDVLEGGFWRMVDDLQLAAFQLAEHKLTARMPPGSSGVEIQRLAAEYANNLAGMVNPLYMNKVYRHARNLVWFAPSYWATYMRMLLSVPGSDRLSGFLAKYRGGEFVRFGNVPLKAVSEAGRRELTRMQRSWMVTYLSTGVAAADMLNVMAGGRHLWENDPGHDFDINVDNFAAGLAQVPVIGGISPGGPRTQASGAVQHTYISSIPFFRQAADVVNAMGMGHDWGLAHQLGDQTWQQADLLHKALFAAGAAADGVRREAANKLSGIPQAAYGIVTGEELSARLGEGVQRKVQGPIGNFDALLSLVPGGLTMERFYAAEKSAQARGGQPPATVLGGLPANLPSALVQQFSGFPSMYHIGPEQPPVDDDKMTAWYKERNNLHDALQNASKQMFMGDMTPLGYMHKRQQLLDRLIELDSNTFGSHSPAAPLAKARSDIATGLGLDNLGLSDADWYTRYSQFQAIWEQTLQSASPTSRAAWWEVEHSQWTDADYLVWEARELKKTIAAAVDGQGGAYIAAYENQIASAQGLPLTTAERVRLEQSDPYYYTYRTILQAMSRSSALGAFINAFSSPFSETYILEQGLTPEEQQQIAGLAPGTASLITPETAAGLAGEAKKLAADPAVAASGGQATASPAFDQQAQQLANEAATGG